MSIVLSLLPVVVLAQTKEPFYLGDYKINCFVPQVNADMYLDTRDQGIVGHLCRGRGWEPEITNGMLNALQPSWTVVDVGANFGWHTLHFANKLRPGGGKVISVEASPRTHSLLQTTLENTGMLGNTIRLHNIAISDRPGTVAFSSTPDRALNNHIVANNNEAGSVQIQAKPLDALLADEPRVDFIKIDVEGFEAKAWRGLNRTLAKNPRCILVIECNTARMRARTDMDPAAFYAELSWRAGGKLQALTDGGIQPITIDALLNGPEVLVWVQRRRARHEA